MGALTYKYLSMYDADYSKIWCLKEHGSEAVAAYEEWLDTHPIDIAPQERGAAIHRANYLFVTYTYAKTRDPKLIKEITRVTEAMNKAETDLQHWIILSNQDGGVDVYIGDYNG